MDVGMPGLKAQALESGTRHTNTNLPYGRVFIHDTIIFHIFYLFQATAYSTGIFRAFTLIKVIFIILHPYFHVFIISGISLALFFNIALQKSVHQQNLK
jgi:hypothetical protein